VALENIRILEEEGIVDRVKNDTGPYLKQRWHELGKHPMVGEARIVGMMGALELVPSKPSRQYFPERGTVGGRTRDIALGNGLILRATNDAMLLSPPLVLSRAQIDELYEKAWKSLDQAASEFGVG
jgi:putrescine aminotransferase